MYTARPEDLDLQLGDLIEFITEVARGSWLVERKTCEMVEVFPNYVLRLRPSRRLQRSYGGGTAESSPSTPACSIDQSKISYHCYDSFKCISSCENPIDFKDIQYNDLI